MNYYLFDFDGTIYDGDSSIDFFVFCLNKNKKIIFNIPKMIIAVIQYKFKIISKTKMKEIFFSFLKKIKDVDLLVKEFWLKNDFKIKEFFIKRDHKKDIIISASPYFLLLPVIEKYKVKDLMASEVDKKNGKFIGENCLGKEKVKKFFNKYPNAKIKEMYSDSLKDAPLLDIASKSFIVIKNELIPYRNCNKKMILSKKIINLYKDNEEIINYLIVGVLTTIVNLLVKWVLLFTILDPKVAIQLQIAVIISWVAAVIFAYVTNRIFVFKSKCKNILKEVISFFSARMLTLVIEMIIMWLFVTLLKLNSNLWVLIWTMVVQAVVIILNYVFSKLFVFKKS